MITACAGLDAVRLALARMPPGGAPPRAAVIARHVLGDPAYAVRYAHVAAAAAAVLRWAGALGTRPTGFQPRLLTAPPAAARMIDTMSTTGFTTVPSISSERLWLAAAARTGLAAGLRLLGVGAPERI